MLPFLECSSSECHPSVSQTPDQSILPSTFSKTICDRVLHVFCWTSYRVNMEMYFLSRHTSHVSNQCSACVVSFWFLDAAWVQRDHLRTVDLLHCLLKASCCTRRESVSRLHGCGSPWLRSLGCHKLERWPRRQLKHFRRSAKWTADEIARLLSNIRDLEKRPPMTTGQTFPTSRPSSKTESNDTSLRTDPKMMKKASIKKYFVYVNVSRWPYCQTSSAIQSLEKSIKYDIAWYWTTMISTPRYCGKMTTTRRRRLPTSPAAPSLCFWWLSDILNLNISLCKPQPQSWRQVVCKCASDTPSWQSAARNLTTVLQSRQVYWWDLEETEHCVW